MNMGRYIVTRIALGFLVFMGALTLTFLVSHVVPSNPVYAWAGRDARTFNPLFLKNLAIKYHLNEPLWTQYWLYLVDFFQGNLGTSPVTRHEVLYDLSVLFPATLELTTVSLIITIAIGIPFGIIAAIKKDSVIDHILRTYSLTGSAMPIFWFGVMLQIVFSVYVGWFPLGYRSEVTWSRITGFLFIDTLLTGNVPAFFDGFRHILLPAFVLSFSNTGLIVRMTRASMLEVLNQDYIQTAKSKGLPFRTIILKHAFKNASIVPITALAWDFATLLQGAVITETIFSWPGLGAYASAAVVQLDFPAIMGFTILASICVIVINLVTDVGVLWVDPRIKGAEKQE